MHQRLLLKTAAESLLLGNRIPRDFFVTSGVGESNITVHAGSYHLALMDAGIERYNIMVYSSILPAEANQIEKSDVRIVHGSVMESIMACANSSDGRRATAAIIFGWLYDKTTGKKDGGIVAEYNGHDTEDEAEQSLKASLKEMYDRGFAEKYDIGDIQFHSRSILPTKKFATALVALCFTSYLFPVLKK